MVRLARRARGISQEELAERVDLSRNTIARIEGTLQDPTVATFTDICFVLGIRGLLVGDGNTPTTPLAQGDPLPILPPQLINEGIAGVLDELRYHTGMSREQCQYRCGVHRNTIRRIECAQGDALVSTVYRLYRMFGVRAVISPETVSAGPPARMRTLQVHLRSGEDPLVVALP